MDDCWHASSRDPATGAPRADPGKFPNGIKALADQVHALGLKVCLLFSPLILATSSPLSRSEYTVMLEREFCFLPNRHNIYSRWLYSMTCGGRFGSLGYEAIDAKTYASWGIDYLSAFP